MTAWRPAAVLVAWGCSHAPVDHGADAIGVDARMTGWQPEVALTTTGPSTEFGNWGKAITTDGAGFIDVVWMQGGSTAHDGGQPLSIGTTAIMFAQSGDEGTTWQPSETVVGPMPNTSLPKIASAGADLYVVWPAQDNATGALQIHFLHGIRTNAAVAWQMPPTIISNTPAGSSAIFPVVTATDDHVFVAWSDTRETGGVTEVYGTTSLDHGAVWSPPAAISPVDGFNSWTPSVAAAGDHVYVAWTDARSGAADCTSNLADCHETLYFRSSSDAGQHWGAETQITCDSQIYTYAPSLSVENDVVHIAYFQGTPYPPGTMDIYYLRAPDHGANITACAGTRGTLASVPLHYPAADHVVSSWRPNISVSAGTIHMTWWGELTNDFGAGQAKIYYASSNDGLIWKDATSLTPQASASFRAISPNLSLSADGTRAYVIWEDHRDDHDALDPNYELYFTAGIP